jgi:hypothetical protein
MRDIVDILKAFGEITHWTVRPAPEAYGGNQSYPPIITWRYKQPSRDAEAFFRRAVSSFRGTISWEFSALQPSWVLMPSRINEYAKSHGDLGGLAAALELMTIDPDFGKRANAELPLLVEHLQQHRQHAA